MITLRSKRASCSTALPPEVHLDRRHFETTPTALLCSEHTAEHCHRRLVLEYLQAKWGDVVAVHL